MKRHEGNQTGKLQARIDRGVGSLMKLVQNFFIDILLPHETAAGGGHAAKLLPTKQALPENL